MPFVTLAIKLGLFVLWAVPTYKSTIEMLEMRERRLGILPPENPDEKQGERQSDQPIRDKTDNDD